MGSENLFHKNRERLTSGFARKSATRSKAYQPSRPHILIVCEDSKSSVFYFEAMANDLRLSAVNVRGGECGSAPSSVLEYAEKQYMQSIKDGDRYDIVYCVFDRDNHDSFETTVKQIKTLNANKKPFYAITTTPCFEFWLLLHFSYTDKAYNVKGNKSSCDCVNQDLQRYWKKAFNVEYGKNKGDIYQKLKGDKATNAIKHAKQLSLLYKETGSENPQTNMHELIEYLQSIKR